MIELFSVLSALLRREAVPRAAGELQAADRQSVSVRSVGRYDHLQRRIPGSTQGLYLLSVFSSCCQFIFYAFVTVKPKLRLFRFVVDLSIAVEVRCYDDSTVNVVVAITIIANPEHMDP